jgi:hypothetical protein
MTWTLENEITASDTTASDLFGYRIACSQTGETMAVSGFQATAKTYVYHGYGPYGTETIIAPSDAPGGLTTWYGSALAMSADGSVIVAGAEKHPNGGTDRGKVYVYTGSSWATETVLAASDLADSWHFGCSVAISHDGSVIAVGAFNADGIGAVYLYTGSGWGTETKITSSDGATNDWFGTAVDLSDDGTVLAVGAPGKGSSDGRVYIYHGASFGTEVIKTRPLAFWESATTGNRLGDSVTLSGDGLVCAAGAPLWYSGSTEQGLIYFFYGTNWGSYSIRQPTDYGSNDRFGTTVQLNTDGSVATIGAIGWDYYTNQGVIYVFDGYLWNSETKLQHPDPTILNDRLGYGNSMDDGGHRLIGGAYGWSGIVDAGGKVYVWANTTSDTLVNMGGGDWIAVAVVRPIVVEPPFDPNPELRFTARVRRRT